MSETDSVSGDTCDIALTPEILKTWKKSDLQKWLTDRGLKKSGNKDILVNRIVRVINFGETDISATSDSSDGNDEYVPNPSALKDGWKELTTENCPDVKEEDILNYFIYSKDPVSGKSKKCKRQLKKAKRLCDEHFLGSMKVNHVSDTYSVIAAECRPSMRHIVNIDGKTYDHYSLHVTIIKTGQVENSSCNCKAGKAGLCAHVGAALFAVVKIKNPCTSGDCKWKKPKEIQRPPSPKRLQDIKFFTSDNPPLKPYPDVYMSGPCKDPDFFLKDILEGLGHAHPGSVLYQMMCARTADISPFMIMYETSFMYMDNIDLNSTVCQSEFIDFVNRIEISPLTVSELNNSTRGQASNENWKAARTCVLTASNFGAICKRKEETPPENLVKVLCGYNYQPKTCSISYGKKYECKARRQYVQCHRKHCKGDVFVEDMGLYISNKLPFLGASVDGKVHCSICGTGVVEIKCPYGRKEDKWRKKLPEECAANPSFYCELYDGKLHLKRQHNYFYQVMGQMAVLEVQWADFVIWTKKGISTERIEFDQNYWHNNMLYKLKYFYTRNIVAEIYTRRVKRGKLLY